MNHQESDRPVPASGTFDLFAVWKVYEKIAVHFNDLILRLRFQALAGVAAISALIGIALKENLAPVQWPLLTVASGVLCLFWIAIGILDIFYYNRLLLGAVDAILQLEDASRTQATFHHLNLSTEIKRAVEGADITRWRRSLRGPLWFYGLVLAGLIALFGFSLCRDLRSLSTSPPAPTASR